jgi:nitric oxide reductase NorD protein
MGMWIIRPDEPQESVEDPMGLERPADRDAEAAPEELADALADLPQTRVIATPNAPREVLMSEGSVPRAQRPPTTGASGIGLVYPEWDYRAQAYRLEGAIVREVPLATGDGAWAKAALERHASLVRRVRRQFARLRPRRSREHGQPDGIELDLEALVDAYADRRAGVAQAGGEDRFYVAERAARRSLAIAVLIDVSASTDSWLAGTRRVIDVEKEALLVVGEALEWLGDRHAMYAFSGEGPAGVQMQVVKAFSERGGAMIQRRIEGLEPDRYTRVGAALRHATARLAMEPAERRLLLLLTDGRPNDVDQYEGRYGVEDTRQAVREAACEGVLVFGLTVDRAAPTYLATLFGPGRAALLSAPERLPGALVEVLRRLVAPGAAR